MTDKREWIEVQFYGLMPVGQTLIGLDEREVAENLAKVFGFQYIDKLTVIKVTTEDD